MRKIFAGLFVSLDGVVEAPETWHMSYFTDEMGAVVGGQMERAGTMLLGRKTYEGFAGFWPNQDPSDPATVHMNETPKLVVSNTLERADWQNSTLVSGDVISELTKLKEQPGKDIAITGSITLVRSMLRHGVLDELSLLVHPVVVGSGMRLFDGETERIPLRLLDSRTFDNGVLYLTYGPE